MSITEYGFGPIGQKKLEVLQSLQGPAVSGEVSILDVGGSKETSIEDKFDYVKYVVDLRTVPNPNVVTFAGDLNDETTWRSVEDFVAKNGKFDFSVCTHTLEDLRNPALTAKMLGRVSRGGLVSMPSVYLEARRFQSLGSWRGYFHHRWLHAMDDEKREIVAVPKTAAFEHRAFDWFARKGKVRNEELWAVWQDDLDYHLFSDDFFPTTPPEFLRSIFNVLGGPAYRVRLSKVAEYRRRLGPIPLKLVFRRSEKK